MFRTVQGLLGRLGKCLTNSLLIWDRLYLEQKYLSGLFAPCIKCRCLHMSHHGPLDSPGVHTRHVHHCRCLHMSHHGPLDSPGVHTRHVHHCRCLHMSHHGPLDSPGVHTRHVHHCRCLHMSHHGPLDSPGVHTRHVHHCRCLHMSHHGPLDSPGVHTRHVHHCRCLHMVCESSGPLWLSSVCAQATTDTPTLQKQRIHCHTAHYEYHVL